MKKISAAIFLLAIFCSPCVFAQWSFDLFSQPSLSLQKQGQAGLDYDHPSFAQPGDLAQWSFSPSAEPGVSPWPSDRVVQEIYMGGKSTEWMAPSETPKRIDLRRNRRIDLHQDMTQDRMGQPVDMRIGK